MRCKEIVPGYILTVAGLLDDGECEALAAEIEGFAASLAGAPTRRPLEFDRPELARIVWRRLAPLVPASIDGAVAVGMNHRFQGLRTLPHQGFDSHAPTPSQIDDHTTSRFSVVICLNDDFRGGSTRFRHTRVPSRKGTALLFRHELEHEHEPVTAGPRYIIRSDILYRREGADLLVDRRRRDWPVGLVTGRHL